MTKMLLHTCSWLLSVLVLLLVPKAFAQDWPCFHPDSSPVTDTDYSRVPTNPGFHQCAVRQTGPRFQTIVRIMDFASSA